MGNKIKSFKKVCQACHKLQKHGKRIVFCHGFFDILHRGHVTLLVEAKKLGDVLVVGVDHDDNAKAIKGPKRPINDHDSRMYVLSNLEPVDYVFLIPSIKKKKNHAQFYQKGVYNKLRPDVVASCVLTDNRGGLLRRKQAETVGAEFVNIKHAYSDKRTTKIIEILGLD